MNRRHQRKYKRAAAAIAREFLGREYTLGGRFLSDPPHGDCRGLYETALELAGAGAAIGGRHINVRAEYAWGKKTGNLVEPGEKPHKADGAIYHEPGKVGLEPSNPLAIRHVAFVDEPPSADEPDGVCISALNPKLGVREHGLYKLHGEHGEPYAVLAFLRPNFDLLDVSDEPSGDPEPPI